MPNKIWMYSLKSHGKITPYLCFHLTSPRRILLIICILYDLEWVFLCDIWVVYVFGRVGGGQMPSFYISPEVGFL